jgi:hypothetical protein
MSGLLVALFVNHGVGDGPRLALSHAATVTTTLAEAGAARIPELDRPTVQQYVRRPGVLGHDLQEIYGRGPSSDWQDQARIVGDNLMATFGRVAQVNILPGD